MHITRPVTLIALASAGAFACGAAAALALTRTNDVEQLIAVDKRQQAAYLTKDMAALDEIFNHGKPFDSSVKFSDTCVRENGTWRNVHAHASKAVDVRSRP